MRFVPVCDADELWVGEMFAYAVEGRAVLLARLEDGYHAVADRCPHQEVSLSEGELAGGVLTCRAHRGAGEGLGRLRVVDRPRRAGAGRRRPWGWDGGAAACPDLLVPRHRLRSVDPL